MKKALRILTLILSLLLALTAFVACNEPTEAPNTEGSTATATKITITVQVVDDKGETKSYTIETAEKYLRGALEQENLVEGEDGPYGLYIKKVNGLSADYATDGAYWAIHEGDAEAMTGVDEIELKDGGLYKLVYTKA